MNIQKTMQELFGNSCYAYCIAYMQCNSSDIKDLTKAVLEGWYKGYIGDDGYVSKPHLFANLCMGKEHFYTDVIKKPYKEEPFDQIVCWEWEEKTHFVVMRNGKVVFNTWPDSNTVKNGKPVSVREFI